MKKGLVAALLAATLAAMSLACSETGGLALDLDTRCDHIMTPSFALTEPIRTERDCPSRILQSVTVNVTPLGGGGGGALADFRLTHYIVTYQNLTGVGSATTAPAAFQESLNNVIGGGNGVATVPIVLLREAAKTAFPLDSDGFYGADPSGGVEIAATVEIWGRPEGQPSRECYGTFTHQFTVYDAPDGSQREMDECQDEIGG